ncbi:response regulator [Granulicella cerasi]|uniref:Response regulator n=1 Tax=Granulicella cerasi TaxID=741063 RepID=A0ABW1ZD16_9BACT|nr:response regulator [Granulicella cerasi]
MKHRILVVDDDRLVADTVSLIYSANGYESQACYSAASGLETARIFAPSMVLCDVTMPEENGLSLLEKLHAEMPSCKVMMFSAYASNMREVHVHAQRTKRQIKLLAKPCPPVELLRETRDLLEASAA